MRSGTTRKTKPKEKAVEGLDQDKKSDQIFDFMQWWHTHSEDALDAILPKVREYGSTDLHIVGEALLKMMPQLEGKVHAAELGISFYLLGKVGRIIGGYADGHAPSDDTWYDTGIYALMAQRVRATGGIFP
jgi:hypothetical protein